MGGIAGVEIEIEQGLDITSTLFHLGMDNMESDREKTIDLSREHQSLNP